MAARRRSSRLICGVNDGCQRVTVIRIARQSGDMGHKLAAFRAMSGRGDTDLYPELVWPMRLALADALHFRRLQGIDLGSALTLILRQHAPREAQRLGEDFFQLGIAVDASPDVADDAAQIGLQPAQASVGALELMGMG